MSNHTKHKNTMECLGEWKCVKCWVGKQGRACPINAYFLCVQGSKEEVSVPAMHSVQAAKYRNVQGGMVGGNKHACGRTVEKWVVGKGKCVGVWVVVVAGQGWGSRWWENRGRSGRRRTQI